VGLKPHAFTLFSRASTFNDKREAPGLKAILDSRGSWG
jgi:hypothetical protein